MSVDNKTSFIHSLAQSWHHKTENNAHILYNGDCQYMKNTMATNIV